MSATATTLSNPIKLAPALKVAQDNAFAIGSFAPRYTSMIAPILRAGQRMNSPLIVQISQREMDRYTITPKEFGEAFREALRAENVTIPVVLHLDHSFDLDFISGAIDAGFTSVMMDASTYPFEENVRISADAAKMARDRGVSIECELGKIGTTDFVETDDDVELYTQPEEAAEFVTRTGVDALAVSVGTAHGAYIVRQPKVDTDRLQAIRELTDVALVLHGGSGVPSSMVQAAVTLSGGGVSKVNIATDLEDALLKAIGREERMTNAECKALPPEMREKAQAAVEATVIKKIQEFLYSEDKAGLFQDIT